MAPLNADPRRCVAPRASLHHRTLYQFFTLPYNLVDFLRSATVAMASSDLNMLVDMGFDQERASIALKSSGSRTSAFPP